jgi:hypothetical protein
MYTSLEYVMPIPLDINIGSREEEEKIHNHNYYYKLQTIINKKYKKYMVILPRIGFTQHDSFNLVWDLVIRIGLSKISGHPDRAVFVRKEKHRVHLVVNRGK